MKLYIDKICTTCKIYTQTHRGCLHLTKCNLAHILLSWIAGFFQMLVVLLYECRVHVQMCMCQLLLPMMMHTHFHCPHMILLARCVWCVLLCRAPHSTHSVIYGLFYYLILTSKRPF